MGYFRSAAFASAFFAAPYFGPKAEAPPVVVTLQAEGGRILRRRHEDMVRKYLERKPRPKTIAPKPQEKPKKTAKTKVQAHPYRDKPIIVPVAKVRIVAGAREKAEYSIGLSSAQHSAHMGAISRGQDHPKTTIRLSSVDLDLELLVALLMEIA